MTGVGAEPIPDGEIPSVRAIRFGREHGQRRLAGSETAISGNGMQKSWLFSTYFRFFRLFPLISAEGFFLFLERAWWQAGLRLAGRQPAG